MATKNLSIGDLAGEIAKISDKARKNVNDAIHTFAIVIQSKAAEKIQKGQRSGRMYKRRSVVHQASSAGEPPKTDTGRLASSIRPVFGDMKAEVGSLANIAKYGAMLEEGTKNMAARPWLEPTLEENKDTLPKLIGNALRNSGLD